MSPEGNPFDVLFQDPAYLEFKNHLYNYMRRKEEILRVLKSNGRKGPILEIGSGVSPIAETKLDVVFSDISKEAMGYLQRNGIARQAVVMSASDIAFISESFATVICSEVIEHIADDQEALREMARVLQPGGELILTFPLHAYYFARDDAFVGHKRRYSVASVVDQLKGLGFGDFKIAKVTGFLDKIVMLTAVLVFQAWWPLIGRRSAAQGKNPFLVSMLPVYKVANRIFSCLVKWEAKAMPLSVTTIALVSCRKSGECNPATGCLPRQ